jgi:hypothetical protein
MPLAEPYPNCCYPGCGEKGVHRHHKYYIHGTKDNHPDENGKIQFGPCWCDQEPLYYVCAKHHDEITLLNKRFMKTKGGVVGRREVIWDLWMRGLLTKDLPRCLVETENGVCGWIAIYFEPLRCKRHFAVKEVPKDGQ